MTGQVLVVNILVFKRGKGKVINFVYLVVKVKEAKQQENDWF